MGDETKIGSGAKKSASGESLWIKLVLTIVPAIITAIIAPLVIQRCNKPPPLTAQPVTLLWAPAKCGAPSEPFVAVEKCPGTHTLEWLSAEMTKLVNARVVGFDKLPRSPMLVTRDLKQKRNQLLTVTTEMGNTWFVSVGYVRETDTDDGCLRLYDESYRPVSDTVCFSASHGWLRKQNGKYEVISP
jgi:hypothetical protein